MSVNKVPEHYTITCDCCGQSVTKMSPSRPSGWAKLTFEQGAEDFQGAEVADASVKAMLCRSCRTIVGNAINQACSSARTALEGETK
jgi:hypothetical protein